MPTVLFAWQLGAGLGHLLRILPLARALASQRYSVFVAFRDLARAAEVFAHAGVRFLQSPFRSRGTLFFPRTLGFAHLLANIGFWDRYELLGLASAWRNLYRFVRPDLIVFDHSPIALLAARAVRARRILLGTGFFCPPDIAPLSWISLRAPAPGDEDELMTAERRMVANVNWVLEQWKLPPIDRLGQLYAEVDDTFLTTFPELDHYGQRRGARYWGPIMGTGGSAPEWPEGSGHRIYAYLKPFAGLPDLLEALRDRGYSTLVFSDGIPHAAQARYASRSLTFCNERLDLSRVAAECDLAILNANHATAASLLLAGKPLLNIPLTAEQQLLGRAVCRIGAGEMLSPKPNRRHRIEELLTQMLADDRHAKAAARFAARYTGFSPRMQQSGVLQRMTDLLPRPADMALSFSTKPVPGIE